MGQYPFNDKNKKYLQSVNQKILSRNISHEIPLGIYYEKKIAKEMSIVPNEMVKYKLSEWGYKVDNLNSLTP